MCTSTRVQVGVQSKHTISSYHRVGEFKFTAAISQAVFAVKFVQSVPSVSAYLNARGQDLSNGVSFIKIGASGRNRQVFSCCALSSFKFQVSSINQVCSQSSVLKFKVYVRLKKAYQHM